jgi:hypothetical protein
MPEFVATKPGKAAKGLGLVILGVSAWFFFRGCLGQHAGHDMKNIEDRVAGDAVKEYRTAVASGDHTAICLHAGQVAAAYLQAQDEKNYLSWKKTEERDCAYLEFH